MGTRSERGRISQNAFADRLRQGGAKPAAGGQVDQLEVRGHSAASATVLVRLDLEPRPRAEVTDEHVWFPVQLEDNRRRLPLSQFLQLAESRSHPQPPQPPAVPTSSPFRG